MKVEMWRNRPMTVKMPELFHRLPKTMIQIFTGRNLLFQVLAIVLTCLIVEAGLDWSYYCATRSEWTKHLAIPAILLGTLVPILATLAILTFGAVLKNRRLISTVINKFRKRNSENEEH